MEESKTERKYSVYRHVFPDGKCYVGMTGRKLTQRWGKGGKGYRRKKNNRYMQPEMAKATLKYDWDTEVIHEVIAEGLTKTEAEAMEIELIRKYNSDDPEFGYNTYEGRKPPQTSKDKMSESRKGEKNGFYGRHHSEDAKNKIGNANKNRKRSEEEKKKISESVKKNRKPISDEGRKKISEINKRPVICIETGVVYESMNAAAEELGICKQSISKCCRGERQTAGGFHWAYYTEQIAV